MIRKFTLVILVNLFFMVNMLNAPDIRQAYNHVDSNSVKVVYYSQVSDIFNDTWQGFSYMTGVCIGERLVLTVCHGGRAKPVGGFAAVVDTPQGKIYPQLELIGYDTKLDLALLKSNIPVTYNPIELAEGYELGEDILFGGYSALPAPKIRFGKLNTWKGMIQVSPVFYGDSGAGVFNDKGELLGMIMVVYAIQMRQSNVRFETFIGYALPLEKIKGFIYEHLLQKVRISL